MSDIENTSVPNESYKLPLSQNIIKALYRLDKSTVKDIEYSFKQPTEKFATWSIGPDSL